MNLAGATESKLFVVVVLSREEKGQQLRIEER
jgi:hypothetical protein